MACGQAVLGELNKIYDPKVYPYPADLGNFSQAYWKLVRYQTDTVPGAPPPRENLCTGCILSMFPPSPPPVFCAFSPSRRGGCNGPQAGTQGQEAAARIFAQG